jgi:hypothetical protein
LWEWARQRVAMILRTDWRRIPSDWLLRRDFKLWPPKRHRAVVWILANFVVFRLQAGRAQTLLDYYDFLRRTRWKLEHPGSRSRSVGNCLSVIIVDDHRKSAARPNVIQGVRPSWINRRTMRVHSSPHTRTKSDITCYPYCELCG